MRSLLLLSILLAAATACNQSLTPDMTGTGGSRTATGGGAGDISPGAGGSGGSNVSQVCNMLIAEYQSGLAAGATCQVGANGQCQQLVSGGLSGCGCPTYVTNTSVLFMLEDAWREAGCAAPAPSACEILCPAALNSTCVATDGGSAGFCSYVPGTGGTSGAGGSGATGGTSGATGGTTGSGGSAVDGGLGTCTTLVSEYAAASTGARSCTPGASGQCAQQVPSGLSPCGTGCTVFVTDSSVLGSIQQQWEAAGCGDVAVACPATVCAPAASATCVSSDAGGSVCSTSYGTFTAN